MQGLDAFEPTTRVLPVDDRSWVAFAATHPAAGPFHQQPWISVVSGCYGFPARVVTVIDRHGEIAAALPVLEVGRRARKRWVSLPFTDRCGPLVRGDYDTSELARTLEAARQAHGVRRLEVRDSVDGDCGWRVEEGYWHELELASEVTDLRSGLNRLRRRRLRRAEEAGIVVSPANSRQDLCEVFFGLHVATRKRLGVPVQPRRLFELLWERVIGPGHGLLLIAREGATPIAAAVFLTANGRMTAKFSARDERYAADGGGMDVVYWDAMRWGCENGYRTFDFGRTETGNDGLRQFKLSWGVREEPLTYSVFSSTEPAPGNGRAQAALGVVIRHSPGWVARAVGTAAYRFAA